MHTKKKHPQSHRTGAFNIGGGGNYTLIKIFLIKILFKHERLGSKITMGHDPGPDAHWREVRLGRGGAFFSLTRISLLRTI